MGASSLIRAADYADKAYSIAGTLDVKQTKVFNAVFNTLKESGLSNDTALKYSVFAAQAYQWILNNPQVKMSFASFEGITSFKTYQAATRLSDNASMMGLNSAAPGLATARNFNAGAALNAGLTYFGSLAKSLGIEVNECALAITKVIEDVLIVVGVAETGIGVFAAFMQAMATVGDVEEMKKACFN